MRRSPSEDVSPVPETLVSRPDELAACCQHLAACPRLGLDTEFVGEDSYHPRLCLIQVAAPDALYLIDPFTVGPLDVFWNIIVHPERQIVVHAGREEVRICHLLCGRTPAHLFDLQIAAGLIGLQYPIGHGTLVKTLLGVRLDKGETLTNWHNRPLTRSQIHYAYDDVRYLLALWAKLSGRLDELGRQEWATEEFGRLAVASTPDESGVAVSAEKWRKLRGLGSLDRKRLAIVRELFNWREEAAAKANRPARTVVRDDLLIEIARRNPAKERDLLVVRGLAKRDLQAIIDTVQRALALPPETWPPLAEREQEPPQFNWLVNLVVAVLGDWSARNHLAANLVAANADVKALVKAFRQRQPPPDDSLLAHGWRAVHVLPELLAVLQGKRALYVHKATADAPFGFLDVPGD
jgi:ribonuclease D